MCAARASGRVKTHRTGLCGARRLSGVVAPNRFGGSGALTVVGFGLEAARFAPPRSKLLNAGDDATTSFEEAAVAVLAVADSEDVVGTRRP